MKFEIKVLEEKAAMLKVIAHPVRLCILNGLMEEGESNVTYIQGCLEIPQSTLSQHLSKLRMAGILKDERRGTEVFYSVVGNEIKDLIKLLFNTNEEE